MNQQNSYEAPDPIKHEAIVLSPDLHKWHQRTEALMAEGARIIALRGAGKVYGIEPRAAEIVMSLLHRYIAGSMAEGIPVVLMYDGDVDNREKPDVGSVFGSLVDSLGDDSHVRAIAVQTESWYRSQTPKGPIESATGRPFETYIFPDTTPGAHASLTQSRALVGYASYEQIYVGPVGPIAIRQLYDLSYKTANRSATAWGVSVVVIGTPSNPAIDKGLHAQLEAAPDEQTRASITAKCEQRVQRPYGELLTPDGELSIDVSQFPGLSFTFTSISTKQPGASM